MAGKIQLRGKYLCKALKILKYVTSQLEQNDIPYWLEAGTLLGIIRENRLLPWDNDIDISIREKDLSKLLTILPKFRRRGYIIRVRKYLEDDFPLEKGKVRMVKIHNRKRIFEKGDLALDIFVKTQYEDQYLWGVGIKRYTKKSVPVRFYDELSTIRFEGKEYSIPKLTEEYLTYRYGDWRTPVKKWDFSKDDLSIV